MADRSEVEQKTQNFLAHYQVIKGQLNQINQEINDAIELKNSYLKQVANLEGEIATKQSELLGLRRELDATSHELEEKTNRIRDTYRKNEEEEERHLNQLAGVAQTILTAQRRVKELEKEIDSLLTRQEDLVASYESHARKIAALINAADETYDKKLTEIRYAESCIKDLKEVIKAHHEEINELEDEMIERENAIINRESELREIAEDHREREQILKNRERDAEVLVRRIKKVYAEIYPGVDIKI